MACVKFKFRYFKKFNGVISEAFTNVEETANNSSYHCGKPYYRIDSKGVETKVKPTFIMTSNLIDGGFHNPQIRRK